MVLKISIAFSIACILLITVFQSQFKGQIGEFATARSIKDLDRNKYIKLHDIKLKNPSDHTKTTQIDHIVISCYGIFCIETKGYKGKIYGKEFSNQWTQYLYGKKYYFMNPILQNYAHIKSLEAILSPYYPNMVYHSIIAFSGEANLDSIEIENAKVCKIAYVSDVIKSLSTEEILSFDEVSNIEKIIMKNRSMQSDFSHTRDIKKIKKANDKKIKQNICPRCGGQLVERNGKYGKFIGCSNFPKCRFVANKK